MHSSPSYRPASHVVARSSRSKGSAYGGLVLGIVAIVGLLIVVSLLDLRPVHASGPHIVSGLTKMCLDDYKNGLTVGNQVDAWPCNGSDAQNWDLSGLLLTHDTAWCLSAPSAAPANGSPVVLAHCSNVPGEVWLPDRGGFENPNSNLCLGVVQHLADNPLGLMPCSQLQLPQEQWTPQGVTSSTKPCLVGSEGVRVACVAVKEWSAWQFGTPSHSTLLDAYSDGNGYEEWCADFVSYVYREAGYPFSGGERDGWDEYDANNIQQMGFVYHDASSGYLPKPGDVAYFNYSGGHVEIVVSGGQNPTFVYGDSGTIDPTTGNGDMKANTILSDGSLGQVVYYLSPVTS